MTVDYATADGTAQAPGDYQARTGTLTLRLGKRPRSVNVQVRGDVIDESNETYFVEPLEPDERDDLRRPGDRHDHRRRRPAGPVDQRRHDGRRQTGTITANFTVTLSSPSEQTVSVGYATADGSAHAPDDYVATGGNVVFTRVRRRRPSRSRCEATCSTRSTRTTSSTSPDRSTRRSPTGRAWARSPTTTRRRPLGQRRHRHRGQHRHRECELHGQPERAQRPGGHRRLRDRQRHRTGTRRLPGRSGTVTFAAGQTTQAGDRAGQRRPARRGERDLLRQPHEPDERDDRRRPGRGHDHGRRRAARAVDQRRHRHRGQCRHRQCELHGQPERCRADGRSRSTSPRPTAPLRRPATTWPGAGRSPSRPARPRSR